MRDPHAFTPMLEEGVGGALPRSLTLGSDLVMNQREIGKFSQRDAKVRKLLRLWTDLSLTLFFLYGCVSIQSMHAWKYAI